MTKKLLVADDSVTIQKVIALTFSGEEVLIETAMNGDEALEKARKNMPDIVLADVFMPGRNGYDLCADIKADPLLSQTPVVLMVGTFEPYDPAEASRVRCDAHITKPFDTAELMQLVNSLVARQAQVVTASATDGSRMVDEHDALTVRAASGRSLVSSRTRESFLGPGRILDFLGPLTAASGERLSPNASASLDDPGAAALVDMPLEGPADLAGAAPTTTASWERDTESSSKIELSDEAIDFIVEKVVKRMSKEVVREIAWEVIPELSESIVRQFLDERGLRDKNELPHSRSEQV